MPWRCYGALPDDLSELDPFRDDPRKMAAIQYGKFNINRVLEEEKPDVVIAVEDIWGIPYLDEPWIDKIPFVFWTPIDSLPLLPVFTQAKDKIKHLWVKARFAQEALTEAGIESRYMPALIDESEFVILSDEKKKELRRRYGIADDTLIFGFVFRNQLRKLVGTLIEGFAEFKKINPKSKLFLHTNWTEDGGWNIPAFCARFGVEPEDVLTTYVCKECRNVSVKPFYGEEMDCQACRLEKTVNTTSAANIGISNEELCEVYNLCDAYVHPMNSGGFEMPVLEALLSGLPTAVTNYSCGTNFTENPKVYPLAYSVYREINSQFDKAQVDPKSVLDFMVKMNEMTKEERKGLGKELRDWAAKEFDSNRICKEVEDFIDSVEPHEYDFAAQKREKSFNIEDHLIKSDKKRILFVEPGSLGECVDLLPLIYKCVEKYPLEEYDYYVSAAFPFVFEFLSYINIIPYSGVMEDILFLEGRGDHKGYFEMAFRPSTIYKNTDFFKNNNL